MTEGIKTEHDRLPKSQVQIVAANHIPDPDDARKLAVEVLDYRNGSYLGESGFRLLHMAANIAYNMKQMAEDERSKTEFGRISDYLDDALGIKIKGERK